jgi:nucleoside-diphosphate-sugar epimerase
MAVVITGQNGFVGSHLAAHLTFKGFEVLHLARGSDPLPLLQRANVVVHLAARVHVMNERSANPLGEFRKANVIATIALARQAAAAGVERFVFMSSIKVNGEKTSLNFPFTEQDDPDPKDAYGQSKLEAEIGLREVAAQTGMNIVIIRPPLIYGPGVKSNFASLIRAVIKGWPLPFGAITNARSFVGIDNLVDFIHCCVTNKTAANETFFVSDGNDLSTTQLLNEIALAAGVELKLLSIPQWVLKCGASLVGRQHDMQRLCGNLQVDTSKARTLLGWRPTVSLQDGLKKTVANV